MDEPLLTINEVARRLNKDWRTVLKWAKAGRLPSPYEPWQDPEGRWWVQEKRDAPRAQEV